MHCQVLAHKIDIIFGVLFRLFNLYRLFRAAGYAFGQFTGYAGAVIASGIQVRDKILEDYAKRTGYGTGLTACATHLIAFYVSVACPLQGIMIARINARRLFAMPADSSKGSVFA